MAEPRELAVTRYVDAPRDIAWRAFTERMEEWWCPKPWTTEVVEQEARPGGRSHIIMRGPDGEKEDLEGVILEFTPGERFIFTDAFSAGWQPQGPFMVGDFRLEDEGSGTRYTASARHWTDEALEQHRKMGFEDGWGAVADQFKAIAEEMAAAAKEDAR